MSRSDLDYLFRVNQSWANDFILRILAIFQPISVDEIVMLWRLRFSEVLEKQLVGSGKEASVFIMELNTLLPNEKLNALFKIPMYEPAKSNLQNGKDEEIRRQISYIKMIRYAKIDENGKIELTPRGLSIVNMVY